MRKLLGSWAAALDQAEAALGANTETGRRPHWPAERITAAVLSFHERYGYVPTAIDFSPNQAHQLGMPERADRFEADGDYPWASTVVRRFGSWSAAIKAAGLQPHRVRTHKPARPEMR